MISQLVASGLALGSIYALLALSLVLINKATGVVNFAQGEMAMFGTFVCFALLTKVGLPLIVVLILAAPVGALLGMATERVTMVRLQAELRSSRGWRVPIATLYDNPTLRGLAHYLSHRFARRKEE